VDLDVDYATTLVAAVLLGIGFVLQQYAGSRRRPGNCSPARSTSILRRGNGYSKPPSQPRGACVPGPRTTRLVPG